MMRRATTEQVAQYACNHGEFRADQEAIWSDISERSSRRKSRSTSEALSGIFAEDQNDLDDYDSHIQHQENQVGAAFAINGTLVGCDCFALANTCEKILSKLVQSYALDAIDLADSYKKSNSVTQVEVQDFLTKINKQPAQQLPAVALGTDCRFDSDNVFGSALVEGQALYHLALFSREESNRPETKSHLCRMSTRRRLNL